MNKNDIILSAKDIEVQFDLRGQILTAIRGVSLDIYRGESLAIVGESGSGKSVFTKTFNGLLDANGKITKGSLYYEGKDLAKYTTEKEWLQIRGKEIAMIMQEPMTSLNPLKTIGDQICEAIRMRDKSIPAQAAKKEAQMYLQEVGIDDPERRYKQYPHEFSGGMRQRVVIAIAIACRPEILICDEPTTALDVTIQAQILKVLKEMKKKYNLTIVFITHDLGVVANIADRIAVMYAGDIIEVGTSEDIFFDPKHPYTWALLSSMPQLGVKGTDLYSIPGNPPNLFTEIKGDAFAPRNPHALQIDFIKRPPYFEVSPSHKVRSWLMDPRAPKVDPPENIRRLKELKTVQV
ncbi:MAG: ABC transporter ATP-binding protein [Lachnospiraceae bacterium]|nr:ABC transporter ATP-binding protein [Lachnospiraceae bacterium]